MTPGSKKLFAELGISVEFNTLCMTRDLIQAYIAETSDIVNAEESKNSQFVKYACYSHFYDLAPRYKMTGFEAFDDLTMAYKIEQGFAYKGPSSNSSITCETPDSIVTPYINLLKAELSNISKPVLLYLSGGLDSEFVARALLDADKPFTPVIFNWLDDNGIITNTGESVYAFEFCKEHKLTPIVKSVVIPDLWKSAEFKQLSQDIHVTSPQLTTHAFMVKMMHECMPGVMHLFGGEVRYVKRMIKSNDKEVNIVKLAKPPFIYSATVSGNNVVLNYATLVSVGWDQIAPVQISITANNVGSNSTSSPALTFDTAGVNVPGSTFTIGGTIIGCGGAGGPGGGGGGSNGGNGGPALYVSGNVAGVGLSAYGGGGGGGGGVNGNGNTYGIFNGGSGGGGGAGYGVGGAAGGPFNLGPPNTAMPSYTTTDTKTGDPIVHPAVYTGCTPGAPGSYNAGGSGGPGGSIGGIGADGFGYAGGAGGGPGAPGSAGDGPGGGSGGAPGTAITII